MWYDISECGVGHTAYSKETLIRRASYMQLLQLKVYIFEWFGGARFYIAWDGLGLEFRFFIYLLLILWYRSHTKKIS